MRIVEEERRIIKYPRLAMFILVLLVALGFWIGVAHLFAQPARESFTQLQGVTYSPFRQDHNPTSGLYPNRLEINEDLTLLTGRVGSIRTYGSSEPGVRDIPILAQEHGIKVLPGAWLDSDLAKNQREINAVVKAANEHANVTGVVVGNEALFRGDLTISQMVSYVTQVKARVNVPVSVAETYGQWTTNPAAMKPLADELDFICVHMLPYWEGVPVNLAQERIEQSYENMQRLYPSKRIVIGEIGWPSDGEYFHGAVPGKWNQETLIRQFLAFAQSHQVTYYVIEAFDQPWKTAEGQVGKHWGLFTAKRKPKFNWQVPSYAGLSLNTQGVLAIWLGMMALGGLCYRRKDLLPRGVFLAGLMSQVLAALMVYYMAMVSMPWLTGWGKAVWFFLLPGQLLILSIAVFQGYEMAELLWMRRLRRAFVPCVPAVSRSWPKVSIHLACCNEPPDIVIRLLESLAALDYPDYEVLVVDNNTSDKSLWLPLQKRCEELGQTFRFFHLENWKGFKAGALNFAQEQMSADARYFGVVDADYVVRADWLKSAIPYFDDPKVGFVQAPQDNRLWGSDLFKEMINWEYAGFFQLGMVHRNERNAIIQHGTMVLISNAAMKHVGNWAQWCICEDAELGLRLMAGDYQAVYLNESFGQGLTPDTFMAYKKQRWRWVFGAMQIIRGHRHTLTSDQGGLSMAQRYHFLVGWLPWVGDAFHLLCTLAMILWTVGLLILPRWVAVPSAAFVIPAIMVGLLSVVRSLWLYKVRVPCTLGQRLAACCAGLSLTYTIGRACLTGMFVKSRPFLRTPKCQNSSALSQCLMDVRDEVALGLMLWLGALGILLYRPWQNIDSYAWMTAMLFQSLPYLAAAGCSMLSGLPWLKLATNGLRQRRTMGAGQRKARPLTMPSMLVDTVDK